MNFIQHSGLKGSHALFGASQSAWMNYDDDGILDKVLNRQYRTQLGTELHEYSASQIDLRHKIRSNKSVVNGIDDYIYFKYCRPEKNLYNDESYNRGMALIDASHRLPDYVFDTVKMYVNDGTGFHMRPEVILFVHDNIYGTADTIFFDNGKLRIHDLKTGETAVHMEQLLIYDAFFCIEYNVRPGEIEHELRIYQKGEKIICCPTAEELVPLMDKIIRIRKILDMNKNGGL